MTDRVTPAPATPTIQILVDNQVASRIQAQDSTLYDFDPEAQKVAENFMGWSNLATQPHCSIEGIQTFADQVLAEGTNAVILIAQGGSVQAPGTINRFAEPHANGVKFFALDSDSPVRVREIFSEIDPAHTLIINASKSGGTIEPRLLMTVVRAYMEEALGASETLNHLVAITDPGSNLEAQAESEGWRAVFSGLPTVGGRYSALSVFGLLPAALMGIDLESFVAAAEAAELACAANDPENPAIKLAAFLFDNYQLGRPIVSFVSTERGRSLGLWIEQLVAESTGKLGEGILPQIEVDPLLLQEALTDRCVVTYTTPMDSLDTIHNFELGCACINEKIPRLSFAIASIEDLTYAFVMWEYATAMLGYLMKVCPFDQPDVASAKAVVLEILNNGMTSPNYEQPYNKLLDLGAVEVRKSFPAYGDLHNTLKHLFESIRPGDYFAINAFLPFSGIERRQALEDIRRSVAEKYGVPSCLEIGPRYLHSTGQLQKGGADNGVLLLISADEPNDIALSQEAASLGYLAKAQAVGDFTILNERGRRCVHLHLPNNSGIALRLLADIVEQALGE